MEVFYIYIYARCPRNFVVGRGILGEEETKGKGVRRIWRKRGNVGIGGGGGGVRVLFSPLS